MRHPRVRAGGVPAAAFIAVMLLGCAPRPASTFPPAGFTPGAPGDATGATRAQVVGALDAVGLQAVDARQPYRPPEGAVLASAPRTVIQVQLPDDPDHGYVVIYALPSAAAAASGAADESGYLASGPGSIQLPPGTHVVLRVAGTTVVLFIWTPGAAPDQRTHLIEDALATIGLPG
jgi:hypothetical protein